MYKVEWEKIDGRTGFWTDADKQPKVYVDVNDAEYMAEWLWGNHSGGGLFAAFRVLDVDGEIYSELECD